MALIIAKEDSAYRCSACGNILHLKKGQLVPPCPRCASELQKVQNAGPQGSSCCD